MFEQKLFSKWAVFVKWCESHQVDFCSPSVNQIADFLLFLFKERKFQPSTIEAYRRAIADMVGNDRLNISKDENLSPLLDSFHRNTSKGRRGVPTWNLSLVLQQLTKAPFEPMRKSSLKHLTFKTVFLLALGSGKRRSKIHACLYKNIGHQENWSQVSLYPSPIFLSKNQLAREGPSCVTPGVIPALAPSLDKSLKQDKSLCPARIFAKGNTWFLYLSGRVSKRILYLLLSLPGSSKLCCYATSSLMRKPTNCIK